jgi:hypothetical protein
MISLKQVMNHSHFLSIFIKTAQLSLKQLAPILIVFLFSCSESTEKKVGTGDFNHEHDSLYAEAPIDSVRLKIAPLPESDWFLYGLNGRVKSIRETPYEIIIDSTGNFFKGEVSTSLEYLHHKYEFDTSGFIWREYFYNRGLEISHIDEYHYNEDHRVLYIVKIAGKEKNNKKDTVYNVFNSQWYLESKHYYVNNVKRNTVLYFYDEENNIIKDSSDENWYRIYKYDSLGNEVESESHSSRGVMAYKNYYNSKNQKTRSKYYNDGNLQHISHYAYNHNGKLISIIDLKTNGDTVNINEYRDNQRGDQVFERHAYLEQGWDNRHTFEYTYDKHGNWIEQKYSKNSEPEYIIERRIEYY